MLMLVGCTKEYTIEHVENLEIENLTNKGQIIQGEIPIDEILDRLDRIEHKVEFNELDYQQFIDAWFNFFLNGEYDKARLDGWSYDYDIDKHEFCYYDNGELVNCETIEEDMR
jgi:hypothetical protein